MNTTHAEVRVRAGEEARTQYRNLEALNVVVLVPSSFQKVVAITHRKKKKVERILFNTSTPIPCVYLCTYIHA